MSDPNPIIITSEHDLAVVQQIYWHVEHGRLNAAIALLRAHDKPWDDHIEEKLRMLTASENKNLELLTERDRLRKELEELRNKANGWQECHHDLLSFTRELEAKLQRVKAIVC